MDEPDREPTGADGPLPRYPAQSRPEQPMQQKQSPWPWVVGGTALAVVLLAVTFVGFVVYALVLLSE